MVAEASVPGARQSPPGFSARFPCFDGIRAIAAMMVIVYHAVFFSTWFRTPGGSLFWNLNAGVWIFFATSGFLLYRPFAEAHLRDRAPVGLRGYAIRRVARIYPAYWAVIAFFTLVVPRAHVSGTTGFFTNVTLTFTYVHLKNPFFVGLPPAWSLVVEVTFYAFLPLYAMLLAAVGRRWNARSVEITGVAVLCTIGFASIVALAEGVDQPWLAVLPQHLVAFALGMLLAIVSMANWSERTAALLERAGRASWFWWGLAAAAFVAIPLVLRVRPFHQPSALQNVSLNVLETMLGAFIVVPAVLGPQDHGVIRRFLSSKVLTFLGLVSYGLYLWHWFLLQIVQSDWLGWPLQKGNPVVVLLVGFPLIVAAASASWYLLERPILRRARWAADHLASRTGA
jgi:peptidoglycan/LPS O-acetylase OafA/YrhL